MEQKVSTDQVTQANTLGGCKAAAKLTDRRAKSYRLLVQALRDLREAALLARTGEEISYEPVQRADALLRDLGEL
jgi:hypothetical protein